MSKSKEKTKYIESTLEEKIEDDEVRSTVFRVIKSRSLAAENSQS